MHLTTHHSLRFVLSAGLFCSACVSAFADSPSAGSGGKPKSMGLIDPAAFGFGRPGFVSDISVIDDLDVEKRDESISFSELRLIAPLAVKKGENFLFASSLGYHHTSVDLDGIGGLHHQSLHTLEAQCTLLWRPSHSRWSAMAFATPGVSSDFSQISTDDFESSGLGLINYRVTDELRVAAGVFGRYADGEGMLVPALGLIWQPEPFIVQVTPPFAVVGWRVTDRWTLAWSFYPSGGAWDIDGEDVNRLEISGWQSAFTCSYQLTEHWVTSVRAGWNVGGELEMQNDVGTVVEKHDLHNAPFVAWNLRYLF
ncbi:MAG: hypothetical protein EAZ81_05835 [Verrucomicrobia bacterium]|nr:MAG: hypothetical protein EAZ81_05835 [Verrucomicrobiota bacterium]